VLPDASLRASPRRLALAAAAAAGALLLAAGALVAIELRRRRHDLPRDGDELDRAVRLLRESKGRSTSDRRRAAGLLGRVARNRVPAVVAGADRVAWSRPEPDGRAAAQLADRAEAEAR
jgi:beta-phosphoglucomutase-like phosphatase (HAD superfamily)